MPSTDAVTVSSWLDTLAEDERAKALYFEEEEFNHFLEAKYPHLTPTPAYLASAGAMPRFEREAELYTYLARRERAKYDPTVAL